MFPTLILFTPHKNIKICYILIIQTTIIGISFSQTDFTQLAINTVPTPPKIRTNIINLEIKISPTINNIISKIIFHNKNKTKTLYINEVENISDHTLNISNITPIIITKLNTIRNNHIIIKSHIPYTKIYNNLKLSNKNLTSRSIAVKLARHIKAHYMLYSIIQKSDKINLEIQLILVKNGEIICSNIVPIT